MKFVHKCPCCNRRATKAYRGVWFCLECYRDVRRNRKIKFVYREQLVISLGQGCAIYRDIPVFLK